MSKYGDGGPFPNNRGQLISPPSSGGSNGPGPANGFPPNPRGVGGPSPPPSVARSSTGTNIYARSESGRSTQDERTEAILGERYIALKKFLNVRDGRTSGTTPKAKDKLLRLTGLQLIELSTDVYDELKRRQDPRAPPNLPPENSFHPKRNQARQKLSSLSSERFQSLATDVFTELGRRFPHFAAGDIPRMSSSSMSTRPPRTTSRRQPSDASSIRAPPNGAGYDSIPPSPGLNGDFSRPMQKQFQSNTIVPNKSTMVEEGDDGSEVDPREQFGGVARAPTNNFDNLRSPDNQTSPIQSEADKRLMEDYEMQVRELREKIDSMEDDLKRKDDELNNVLDGERARASQANAEQQGFDDLRLSLENKLAEAQNLNDSLRDEIERARADHSNETRELRGQISDLQDRVEQERQAAVAAGSMTRSSGDDPELQRENRELQDALREQQDMTNEVRRNAQDALREMRELSQQSNGAYERQEALERTVDQLEEEVRDWRNRYTKAKTQLRSMRAVSMGLAVEREATVHLREKGLTDDNGLVKDVHVTKFQVAIDDILQQARTDNGDKIMDAMKAVVVSVRRINKDLETSPAPQSDEFAQQQGKLKSKVSQAANAFITASKNHANSAGLAPVALLDAAASHVVGAVVDLLRAAKIRPSPAGELDDEDGMVTPVDSTGFFSTSNSRQESMTQESMTQMAQEPMAQEPSAHQALPPPPPFRGLGPRESADSSAYSPINSPRESADQSSRYQSSKYPSRTLSRPPNGVNDSYYGGMDKSLPPPPPPDAYDNLPTQYGGPDSQYGGAGAPYGAAEDLKLYVDDQTAVLVSAIQNLVGSIRGAAPAGQITDEMGAIAGVVDRVIAETQASGNGELVARLSGSRNKLVDADARGRGIVERGKGEDREWRAFTQGLPPVVFELAREMKELGVRVDELVGGGDDFS